MGQVFSTNYGAGSEGQGWFWILVGGAMLWLIAKWPTVKAYVKSGPGLCTTVGGCGLNRPQLPQIVPMFGWVDAIATWVVTASDP